VGPYISSKHTVQQIGKGGARGTVKDTVAYAPINHAFPDKEEFWYDAAEEEEKKK